MMACPIFRERGVAVGWPMFLGLEQNAPGVCVPALRTSRLHAMRCVALSVYCRASTVEEEGSKPIFCLPEVVDQASLCAAG